MKRPIFFDTETTGIRSDKDRIVEIAAYDPVKEARFERLINPHIPIPAEATAIHKITNDMVKAAAPFSHVASEFIEFCSGEAVLIAHNAAAFDIPFLYAEFRRAGLSWPSNWTCIDSLVWARKYRRDLPRHTLQYLRQVYGIAENQAHRALNDVETLYEVFRQLIDDLSIEQVIQRIGLVEAKTSLPPQQKDISLGFAF